MTRSRLTLAASALALGLPATVGAAHAADMTDDAHTYYAGSAEAGVVADSAKAAEARSFLTAVLAVAGAAVTAFGAHAVVKFLTGPGRRVVTTIGNITREPNKAFRQALSAAGSTLDSTGRFAAKGATVALGVTVALALIDVSWKASLVVGTGTMIAGAVPWKRKRRAKAAARAAAAPAPVAQTA